jgi:hypothetical protein
MQHQKGELRPFNNILFLAFRRYLERLKYPPMEVLSKVETILNYLHYLEQTQQKITTKEPNQLDNYFNYLKEIKGLKIKELLQKKSDLELFYEFIERYF